MLLSHRMKNAKSLLPHRRVHVAQRHRILQLLDVLINVFQHLKCQRIYLSIISIHYYTMNLKILIVTICIIIAVYTQTINFESDDLKAVFTADWLQDSHALDEYIPKYQQIIKEKKIKSLSLSFSYCKNPQYILNNIFNQPISVQILHLNLDTCKIGHKGIARILKKINENSIRQLHLNLNSAAEGEQIGNILGQAISNFHLRSLRIGLMMTKLGNQGLTNMFLHPLNSNLQQLSLDLTTNKLQSDGFQNFSHYLSNLNPERLRFVELIVRSNRIQQNGTFFIAKALKQFTKLTLFKFDAYFNSLKAPGVKPISLLIKRFVNIKILQLNFDLNYIQTEGGRLIGQGIKDLNSLQYLQIGVGTKNFGFNGYNHIVDGMSNLTNLKSLTFRCGVNRIGVKGAHQLKLLLQKMSNLQYLQLNLVQNLMLDDGLSILSQSLAQMNQIKTFKLNFGFNQVKSFGLVDIFKTCEQKDIPNLQLGLSNNPLQDAQIKLVLPYIKKILSKCQRFDLEFLYTDISESLMGELTQLFESAKQKQKCIATLHANNKEQIERVRQQIQISDEQELNKNRKNDEL